MREEQKLQMAAEAEARGSHLDLIRTPYVLYGVKYIDLVSLALFSGASAASSGGGRGPEVDECVRHLDLIRAPCCYGLYGVKYIGLVSLAPFSRCVRQSVGGAGECPVAVPGPGGRQAADGTWPTP